MIGTRRQDLCASSFQHSVEPDIEANRMPAVSVVVATHNRARLLERLLDALAVQVFAEPFEVIVVDDASTDQTLDFLGERAAAASAFPLVPLRQATNAGPAAARNRGWREARAPIVCFTDDDCIPSATWLAELTAAIDEGADLAQGRTEPAADQSSRRGPFSMTMERRSESGFYETCNIAYRREWLERLGGFDEDFRYPFGEDTDLAWRARKAGAHTTFVDKAVVEHEIWPFRWKTRIADIRRREGMVVLVEKHPELRSLFPSRWFHKATHPRAIAAAAGLVSVAARPSSRVRPIVAVAVLLVYWNSVKPERANVRRRDWPWVLPLCLASDLADIASLARAGFRRRILFL